MNEDKDIYKWKVQIFGKRNSEIWEISVVREDNKHGQRSYGWFDEKKFLVSHNGGPCRWPVCGYVKENRNTPLQVRGSKCDNKGNRKFSLDIINNNRVIFKPKKGTEIHCNLPKLSKQYKKQLFLLEELCNSKRLVSLVL
jgi:hypothetical protein